MGIDEPPAREGLATRGRHWRLWVGLDGVLRGVLEGDQDRANVAAFLDALAELGAKVPERPVRILFYGHRALRLAPEAREALADALRAHVAARVAVVRAAPLVKVQARAIARRSGHDILFHDSEPEALQALGVPAAPPPPPRPAAQPDVGAVDHIA